MMFALHRGDKLKDQATTAQSPGSCAAPPVRSDDPPLIPDASAVTNPGFGLHEFVNRPPLRCLIPVDIALLFSVGRSHPNALAGVPPVVGAENIAAEVRGAKLTETVGLPNRRPIVYQAPPGWLSMVGDHASANGEEPVQVEVKEVELGE